MNKAFALETARELQVQCMLFNLPPEGHLDDMKGRQAHENMGKSLIKKDAPTRALLNTGSDFDYQALGRIGSILMINEDTDQVVLQCACGASYHVALEAFANPGYYPSSDKIKPGHN